MLKIQIKKYFIIIYAFNLLFELFHKLNVQILREYFYFKFLNLRHISTRKEKKKVTSSKCSLISSTQTLINVCYQLTTNYHSI
jgi:hypothetical protein